MSDTDLGTLLAPLVSFFGEDEHGADALRRAAEVLQVAPPAERQALAKQLASTGATWGYHPPNPLARRVERAVSAAVYERGSGVEHAERLAIARRRPVVFFPNHLSFADANLFDGLLHEAGWGDIGERLTVLAGPKVYSVPYRRFSSLCFGTIKTPQSTSRASGEAVMSRREVAKVAQQILAAAAERRKAGDHLLVFAEGTRSRDGGMQRTLDAVSRYLTDPGVVFVPVGIVGSEKLVPVGDDHVHRTRVTVRIGHPVNATDVLEAAGSKRRVVMDVVGLCIARLLPPSYRGAYGDDVPGLDEARAIAVSVCTPHGER